ncbi:MAG: UvrD-helicase domain-containing protein, partial [Elusimicrobia bacterium]|nr:UvrD-helicase domain-containing protein [Elusimicrobiota bacterium]
IITKTLSAKHRNVCVVGDPDQSIYSWRGADIRNILEFEHDFQDAKVVALEQNYRSTPEILAAAGHLIEHNTRRKPKQLFTDKPSGRPVLVEELPTEADEARWTARQIERLCSEEKRNFGDFAVFYRTNAQSRSFEEAFRREKIPYRIIGAVRFYDRKEIRDALAYARLIVNPYDAISLERILNVPARGIGKAAQDKLLEYASANNLALYAALRDSASIPDISSSSRRGMRELAALIDNLYASSRSLLPSDLLQKAIMMSRYWQSIEDNIQKDPEEKERLGNLQELLNGVKEYEERCAKSDTMASMSGYLQEVSLISGLDAAGEGVPSVTLMTVHLAKGLEFPVVFVTGLEEGLFPITAGATEPDELEEERRLCYVGMTRARERLFMTCAATRRMFGKTYTNIFSRFLYESKLIQPPENPISQRLFASPAERGGSAFPKPETSPRAGGGDELEGRKVRHALYGEGKIILATGSGESAKITVLFRQGGKHTFMMRYAPIEML